MRAINSILVLSTLGCLATAAGCGDDIAAQPDDQGAVTFDLTLAPVEARCAVVTVAPAMGPAVVRQFPLLPSQTAVFSLTGLPTGNVTISEQVFTVACAMTGGTAPTWIADPVMVTLQAGAPVSITFNLRRVSDGGQVNVSTNFPQASGSFQEFLASSIGMAGVLIAITAGPDDALWYADLSGNAIGRITTAGAVSFFPLPNPDSSPTGITTGSDGNLWFTEQAGRIGRLTPSGTITEFPLASTSQPILIAAGPDGALWFAEIGVNRIGRITTSGVITEFNVPTAASGIQGVAVGPDRNIWFAEPNPGKIGRLTVPGGTITEFNIPTPTGQPIGLVAGPDGNVWFTEIGGNKIGRITTGGTVTEFNIPTPNTGPAFITVGADGALWFTEQVGDQIGRITTAGAITEFAPPTPNSSPTGIALGPDARIWFTELGAGQVGAFRP